MNNRLIFAAIAVLIVSVVLVVAGRETNMRSIQISATEAREKMAAPGAIILDVRSYNEFTVSRIPGAVLLPNDEVRARARSLLPDKNALILIYCRSGVRSRDAAEALIYMGYTNVYDFGGIIDWPYDIER